jgi:probable F420-dependent oxidoreductase
MRFGIHLPQYGRAASPDAIARAARQAEELGFTDVWVSDHLAVPEGAPYPPAFLYEPVVALTWAAAATTRVRLGTSVLVLPYRHPLHLAKELATLDVLSGGRLLLGAAAGWLEGEFAALGVPFRERGARTDECLAVLRACWGSDPVTFTGRYYQFETMKVLPKPVRTVPIWIGGASDAALRRAVREGDGWHGTFTSPADTAPRLKRLREEGADEGFALSMRVAWDGLATAESDIARDLDAFAELGVDHLMASPTQGNLDDWLRSVEELWRMFSRLA